MIRILAHDNKTSRPIVVLGLEEENLRRLPNDKPIRVNLKHLDPDGPPTELPDIDIVIAFDDGTLMKQFEKLTRKTRE